MHGVVLPGDSSTRHVTGALPETADAAEAYRLADAGTVGKVCIVPA